MQLAMIEVIDLEDDDDSQAPSQIEFTQQQKSRAARNKEIALARLQARRIRDSISRSNPLQFCTTQEQSNSSVENLGTPPLYDRPSDRFFMRGGTQQVKKRDHPMFDRGPVLRRKLNSHQTDATEMGSPGNVRFNYFLGNQKLPFELMVLFVGIWGPYGFKMWFCIQNEYYLSTCGVSLEVVFEF